MYEHEMIDTRKRDAFFLEWKHGPFDLYYFIQGDKDKMKKRLQWLRGSMTELGDNGPQVANYMQALKEGQIDEAAFQKDGAALAFQWVMSHETTAHKDQAKKNTDKDQEGQPHEGQLFGQGEARTLDQVDWDSDMVSAILSAILSDIDPTLEVPKNTKLHQREVNPGQFWITRDHMFNAIFKPEH